MQNHRNRPLVWLTIGLAAAATTAPATLAAGVSPDDRAYSRAIAAPAAVSLSPDDRAYSRSTAAPAAVSLSPDDRLFSRSAH